MDEAIETAADAKSKAEEALEKAENNEVGVIDNSLHLKALEGKITTM